MSVQHEVWIAEVEDKNPVFGVASDIDDGGTRYLLASLTCGECKSRTDWTQCPNYHETEDGGDIFQAKDTPACMAFVPSVQP